MLCLVFLQFLILHLSTNIVHVELLKHKIMNPARPHLELLFLHRDIQNIVEGIH